MTGINGDIIDKIIKVNRLNLDSLEKRISKIKEAIIKVDNCYSGNSISFISKTLIKQLANLEKIYEVNQSYIDVLQTVKISYTKQDEKAVEFLSAINKKF